MTPDQTEIFEERAAIIEEGAQVSRQESECHALQIMANCHDSMGAIHCPCVLDKTIDRDACLAKRYERIAVKTVVAMPDNARRRDYLGQLTRTKGKPYADRIRSAAMEELGL